MPAVVTGIGDPGGGQFCRFRSAGVSHPGDNASSVHFRLAFTRRARKDDADDSDYRAQMKGLLVFVAFVALAGFAVWQHLQITSLSERPTASIRNTSPAARVKSRAIPKATPGELKKIICPLCHGEKSVAYIPAGRDLLHKEVEVCPVCLGVGYRMLRVPPGYQACPDCQGMGIVFLPAANGQRIRSDNCVRCGASGLVATIKK